MLRLLDTLKMMDEMYGPTGDKKDTLSPYSLERSTAQPGSVATADVREEIVQLRGFTKHLLRNSHKVRGSESTILRKKLTAGLAGAGKHVFPVLDEADEAEIRRWLDHPDIEGLASGLIVNVAAQTPMPTSMMTDIMRRLLGEQYESLYREAERSIKDRWA